MNADGTFFVSAAPAAVAELVTHLDRFAPCVPGFDSILSQGEDDIALKVKVGVGAMKGTMNTKLRIVERSEFGVRYNGTSTGLGSEVQVVASFAWMPEGEGTNVRWAGDAQNSGRLAAMGKALMESAARKNILLMMENVRTTLNAGAKAQSAEVQ